MSRYEQLSMFTMTVEQVTATCCMDGCPARASPVEPWMAALIPAGEYVVQIAGHALVLRPMPGRQADIYLCSIVFFGGELDDNDPCNMCDAVGDRMVEIMEQKLARWKCRLMKKEDVDVPEE